MNKIEKMLSDTLNNIAEKDGYFDTRMSKTKYGLIKKLANGKEIHRCQCGSLHSGGTFGTHICNSRSK